MRMKQACWVIMISCALPLAGAPPHPSIDKLLAEAKVLQQQDPAEWAHYDVAIAQILKKLCYGCRGVSMATRPDLRSIKLPLARLVVDLVPVNTSRTLDDDYPYLVDELYIRENIYLDAIGAHADERRIDVLVEYRDVELVRAKSPRSSCDWNTRIGEGASKAWAIRHLPALLSKRDAFSSCGLALMLLQRFGETLPLTIRHDAYRKIRATYPGGPADGVGAEYWSVLVHLRPDPARAALLKLYDKKRADNIYVISALDKVTVNKDMALAARRWLPQLSRLDDDLFGDYLRAWIVQDDPVNNLEPTVNRIKMLVADRRGYDAGNIANAKRLVNGLLRINSSLSRAALAQFANNKELELPLREQIVTQLAIARYDGLQGIIARWLAEEGEYGAEMLRDAAKASWGPSSKQLLRAELQRTRR